MSVRARIGANALFVTSLAFLWASGFCPSPDSLPNAELLRIASALIPGLTPIALGLWWWTGHRESLQSGFLLVVGCVIALRSALVSYPVALVTLPIVDGLLNGMLFFCLAAVYCTRFSIIDDVSVPAGLLFGSLLVAISGQVDLPALLGGRDGGLSLSFVALVGCVGSTNLDDNEEHARKAAFADVTRAGRPLLRAAFLRYAAVWAGAVALAFVFGVMTDLQGWMATKEAQQTIQIANGCAAAAVAVVVVLYRKPFRVDVALVVALPLFVAALISSPSESHHLSFARLAIMVGYLLFFMISWVLVRRDACRFRVFCLPVLASTIGMLLVFSQMGRLAAALVLASPAMSPEALSAISLTLFWALLLVAAGVYWLSRSHAVERDLALLEEEDRGAEAQKEPARKGSLGKESGIEDEKDQVAWAVRPSNEFSGGRRDDEVANSHADVILVDRVTRQAQALAAHIGLSAREMEVLEEFARGRSAVSIAERLFISPNTVKTHLRRIYEKAGIHSRRELLDMMDGISKADR